MVPIPFLWATAPGLREIFHSWGPGATRVPRAGTSIHHLPGRASQTAAFHLRLQKPETQGRKGALNLANTRWLTGVGQCLEPLCTGCSTTPPQFPISHQHLVPWGRDSSTTSHHLRDPSHPRASSSPIVTHYPSAPFGFYTSTLFGSLCRPLPPNP